MDAACGVVDITPRGEVWLEAYDRAAPTTDVVDPIEASVTVFVGSGRPMALVSVDNVTVPPWIADRMRQRIATALGTETHQVMVAYTHSHSTPRWDDTYERDVTDRLVVAARDAARDASTVTIAQGVGHCDAATNARVAKVAMFGEIERAEPIDPRVPVSVLSDVNGRPVVAIVRYTAHPTVLTGLSNTVSADYPGRVRRIVASQLGCPVVFLQGSCGDIAPGWRGDETALDTMGGAVGDAALVAIDRAEV